MVTEALGQVKQIKARLKASGIYYAMVDTHIYQCYRETHVTVGFLIVYYSHLSAKKNQVNQGKVCAQREKWGR